MPVAFCGGDVYIVRLTGRLAQESGEGEKNRFLDGSDMAWWASDIFLLIWCFSKRRQRKVYTLLCSWGWKCRWICRKEMLLQATREAYWLATVGIF
jgi:hypothetical protein